MHRRSLFSMISLAGLLLASAPLEAQTAGGTALEQGKTLLDEIRALVSDASSRVAAVEAAQPPQVSVASCLNQVVQTLNQYESSGVAALNSLESAVDSGDSATASSQLSVLILANKNAKTAATTAAACEAGGVVGATTDANGDGVPDSENSTGGMSGVDDLQGEDSEVAGGFAPDEFVPEGDSIEDPATSDVVTSPAVTP